MRRLSPVLAALFAVAPAATQPAAPARELGVGRCPADMVRVREFCIDRYEMATVDRHTGELLSPYYPPHPRLLAAVHRSWIIERERVGDARARELPLPELPEIQRLSTEYEPRALSKAGLVPQAYLSFHGARTACVNAGKRLCTEQEWVSACKGSAYRKFPYGEEFEAEPCNVYRPIHPAYALHGGSFYGHLDPRLNLVTEVDGSPLLRLTGASRDCASRWGDDRIYDMVGNVDEWVEVEPERDGERARAAFLGGFYARSTREGCESRVGSHAPVYYDYSTGGRCCRDATE